VSGRGLAADDVYLTLRERYTNAFGVETVLDRLRHVEFDGPVIARLRPHACDEIDTAVGQFGYDYLWRRVGEDTLVLADFAPASVLYTSGMTITAKGICTNSPEMMATARGCCIAVP